MFDILNHISVLVLLIAIWSFVEVTDPANSPFPGVGACVGIMFFIFGEIIIWPIWYLFLR